jgi:hypothetical protein
VSFAFSQNSSFSSSSYENGAIIAETSVENANLIYDFD